MSPLAVSSLAIVPDGGGVGGPKQKGQASGGRAFERRASRRSRNFGPFGRPKCKKLASSPPARGARICICSGRPPLESTGLRQTLDSCRLCSPPPTQPPPAPSVHSLAQLFLLLLQFISFSCHWPPAAEAKWRAICPSARGQFRCARTLKGAGGVAAAALFSIKSGGLAAREAYRLKGRLASRPLDVGRRDSRVPQSIKTVHLGRTDFAAQLAFECGPRGARASRECECEFSLESRPPPSAWRGNFSSQCEIGPTRKSPTPLEDVRPPPSAPSGRIFSLSLFLVLFRFRAPNRLRWPPAQFGN